MATPDRKEVIKIIEEKIDELKRTASRYNVPFTLNFSYDGVGFKIDTQYNNIDKNPDRYGDIKDRYGDIWYTSNSFDDVPQENNSGKLTDQEKKIYEKLKQLNTFVMQKMQDWGYCYPVLTSQIIFAMIKERPSNLVELLKIKGIGEKKLESIGEACLAAISGKDMPEILRLVKLPAHMVK